MAFQSLSPFFFILLLFFFFFFLTCLPPHLQSQQPYEGLASSDCDNLHNSTSLLGYFCNGQAKSCQACLTFHSHSPYQSVSTISALLGSDPAQLSRANSVPLDATFPTNTKVLVSVNCSCSCSCSGGYYQFNTSYSVQHGDTAFIIANKTYQGLTTCQALQYQNTYTTSSSYLFSGMKITVPLRCACPTSNQSRNGVRYLVSYSVDAGNTISIIDQAFGVATESIFDANELSLSNTNIYPFTTLLVPLKNQPNGSQLATPIAASLGFPSEWKGLGSCRSLCGDWGSRGCFWLYSLCRSFLCCEGQEEECW